MDTGELTQPEEVDVFEYDSDEDPHGLVLTKLRTDITSRQKMIQKTVEDIPKCRALMWKYLSKESQEAVLGSAGYDVERDVNNCLQLALSIETTHQGGGAPNEATRRSNARLIYNATK